MIIPLQGGVLDDHMSLKAPVHMLVLSHWVQYVAEQPQVSLTASKATRGVQHRSLLIFSS